MCFVRNAAHRCSDRCSKVQVIFCLTKGLATSALAQKPMSRAKGRARCGSEDPMSTPKVFHRVTLYGHKRRAKGWRHLKCSTAVERLQACRPALCWLANSLGDWQSFLEYQ
mmetsp:Transcript_60776/g.112758  ORF Transcript_60776/g.112758 Transcript_60776/m.112758 type:complete len:111 (+) Transcript_60776:30-362(+)